MLGSVGVLAKPKSNTGADRIEPCNFRIFLHTVKIFFCNKYAIFQMGKKIPDVF